MSDHFAVNRSAPRVPPGRNSLAAAFQAHQRSPRGRWNRFVARIEPWYDTGKILVERMQEIRVANDDRIEASGEGFVRYFEVQFLGVHLQLQIRRTPKAVR